MAETAVKMSRMKRV